MAGLSQYPSHYGCACSPYLDCDSEVATKKSHRSPPASRVRLFLPFRTAFHYYGDPRVLSVAVTRSPEDPRSLHPAFLNAIYLSTCWIVGGELDPLKDYFLAQTRLHMGRALETVDRLTHFLWASLILGTFLALEGRTNEAYVTVSTCVEFALACGLDVVHYRNTPPPAQEPLLPPPFDEDDAIDRARLSRAIYILDRTLAMVSGTPSAFSGANGPLTRPSVDLETSQNGECAPGAQLTVTSEVRRKHPPFFQSTSRRYVLISVFDVFLVDRIVSARRNGEASS